MKKILFKSALLALAAPLFLASCSSDSNDEPNIGPAEDFQGILLTIPRIETRAFTYAGDEATINKLKVIIYDADQTNPDPVWAKDLSGNDVSNIKDQYTSIPVALPTGHYKMYLVANIDGYEVKDASNNTISDWSKVKESALQTAKITSNIDLIDGSTVLSSAGDSRKYLPMGCANAKVLYNGSALGNNGKIPVTAGSKTTVQAPLTFSVAKVVCTVINKDFPAVSMETPTLNPYSTTSGLVDDNEDRTLGTDGAKDISGGFFKLDASGNITDNATTNPTSETTGWGWTSTFYIAENLYDENETADTNKTVINFDFSNDTYDKSRPIGEVHGDNDAVTSRLGVKRGNLYTMTGTIKGKTLDIKVAVNEWQYHKSYQEISED